jgi:thioredoxin reductase
MLGRCRRRVLVCDLGAPRNRRSRALHGFLTRDGISPAELNEFGRMELQRYGVELRRVGVIGVRCRPDHHDIALADGTEAAGRYLLIATGVIDDLPGISGFEECYGRSLFHCPYCDGWEWRDRRIAAFGGGRAAVALALGLRTWSRDIVLVSNGHRVSQRPRARLAANDIAVRTETVIALEHDGGELRRIRFATGEAIERDALFFTAGQHPQSPLAITLGGTLTRHGTVKTGNRSDTNVPRVFVAGDASRDAQFAIVAAAEGVKAAVAINQALQTEELR